MVCCTVSLRAGSGGVVLRIVIRDGTTWVTIVASIPATTAATLGTTCGVFRPPSMVSTSAKVSSS